MMAHTIDSKKSIVKQWFITLRDLICSQFEILEAQYGNRAIFERSIWERDGGGGGEMSIMRGGLFEKVGVNISTVFGKFSEAFCKEIPGAVESRGNFWASGISLVSHMMSPLIPTIHMNTRFIITSNAWFGGGIDLTPVFIDAEDTATMHKVLKEICYKFDQDYQHLAKECDEYFFLKHRNELRGVGGIFFDYLNSGNWDNDFNFIKEVGLACSEIYSVIIKRHALKKWTTQEKEEQLLKRGRYVEFNLLYDRGTKFGLMTGGNIEAILMSLPPKVKWR